MLLVFRAFATAAAVALSTAAFAGNNEGNKPLNNIAATAPPTYTSPTAVPETRAAAETGAQMPVTHRYHRHYQRYSRMNSPGEQQMGNGSNGTNTNNGVSGNTSGMGNSESTNPQSHY